MGKEWFDDFRNDYFNIFNSSLNIEKAIKLKFENLPSSIFKFRNFDDKSFNLQNLENDNVKITNPNDFNDPYDCEIYVNEDTIVDQIATPEIRELLLNIKEFMYKSNEVILKTINPFYKNSLKVCSFSEVNDSILMWSHYASNHSGFCIEYDIKSLTIEDDVTQNLFPVIYTSDIFDATEYMIESHKKSDSNDKYMTLSTIYKANIWSYEKEWRLVLNDNHSDFFKMPKPKAIYLGSKISDSNKEKILAICEKKDIDVYQMSMEISKFEFKKPSKIKSSEPELI